MGAIVLSPAVINVADFLFQLWSVFYKIVFPVLMLAGIGFVLQRKLKLDMPTLTRLNFYYVVPAIVYFSLVSSKVTAGDIGIVIVFTLALMAGMSLLTYVIARLRGIPPEQRAVATMAVVFDNSGNFGLPVQELAFSAAGLGAWAAGRQVFVMITQNFATFTYGILLATGGRSPAPIRNALRHAVRFPPLYAIAAAVATIGVRWLLGDATPTVAAALEPFWTVVRYAQSAFIAVALCTLGAQLAMLAPHGMRYPVTMTVLLRLLVAPVMAMGIIYGLGVSGYMAQMLLISSCSPTAVNCMLMCLQFDNHPDFAARSVFYSTLLSPLTVTLVIFVAQSGLLPVFAPGG